MGELFCISDQCMDVTAKGFGGISSYSMPQSVYIRIPCLRMGLSKLVVGWDQGGGWLSSWSPRASTQVLKNYGVGLLLQAMIVITGVWGKEGFALHICTLRKKKKF